MTRSQSHRILDANFNRSREGLRVCEDVARFVWEDKALSRDLKKMRHDISNVLKNFPELYEELLMARNSTSDIGQKFDALESGRVNESDLFLANFQRVKESLRTLEEVSKILNLKAALVFKKIRFYAYTIEKKSLPRLETLRHHRTIRSSK